MKTALKLVLAGLLLGAWTLHAGPPLSITVNPTEITNNYVGSIQLSISNLSSAGVKVRVDRFLDVNSNGVVDGNEWAGQSFYVTDGQEPSIGGVRNGNVPGDDDGLANQTIQSHVPYPSVNLTLEHVSGQYLYRVTDLGSGQTATALLGIAQQVLPQGVTGQVFAPDGTPLGNSPVVVTAQIGDDGFGTISDLNGNFTIYATPGDYDLFPVYAGQVANTGGMLSINAGAFASENLTNVASDGTTISGNVTDSATAVGLPGIAVQAQTSSGLGVFLATGTNGAYTLMVNKNDWKVKVGGGEGSILGYCRGPVTKISANASSGSVAGINFQLIKGNALVYGTVTTAQSNAVPSLNMEADDTNNSVFDAQGLTDANGNYSVALVAGGDEVTPNNSDLTGYLSPFTAFFTVSSGDAIEENFVLQSVSATLSGVVQDNLGNPIGNIELIADPANDTTGALNQNFQSASDGSFSVAVNAGDWNLFVECNTANSSNLISEQLTVDVASSENVSNLVLIAQHATATIYGTVTDSSGSPLSGVNMFANAIVGADNYVSGCDSTDTNGHYSILVFATSWSVGGNNPGLTNHIVTVTGTTGVMLDFVVPSQGGPPSLGQPVLSGGQFQFQVMGNSGQNYRIDESTNLLPNGWTPVSTNIGSFSFTNAVGTSRSQFYRAVAVP
jgi:hypothetical protein